MVVFILWLIFSVIVGVIGSDRKIGFVGAFLLAFLLSPVIGLIITLISKHQNADLTQRRILWTQQQQLAALTKSQEQKEDVNKKSISEELESLQKMKEAGHLTEEEYQQAKNKVIAAS